ncbi:hypothetical protein AB9Q10_27645 [Streptomyces krungchingensis]|uniref:hypothetical protein n=1 Tax=Streptomyces TaxID=1883 RepID=UPI003CF5D381
MPRSSSPSAPARRRGTSPIRTRAAALGQLRPVPEGGTVTHSATDDCTFLFITGKPFDIQHVGD